MLRYLFLAILLLIACSPESTTSTCPNKTCNDYTTQPEAQAAYDADKTCLGGLDDDHDGLACESLPASTGGCPSTGNCGCSNKKKDDCASTCCKWVVGTGCVCK